MKGKVIGSGISENEEDFLIFQNEGLKILRRRMDICIARFLPPPTSFSPAPKNTNATAYVHPLSLEILPICVYNLRLRYPVAPIHLLGR